MTPATRHILPLLLLVAAAPATQPATRPAARLKCRVIGLFAPTRVDDLRETIDAIPGVRMEDIDFDRGTATFAYEPAVAFGNLKPDKYVERLSQLIRQTNNTFDAKPASGTPADKLTRVTIHVAGLDCRACELAAYEIVAKVDGVEQATASFREGKVTALLDPARTDRAKLVEALKKRTVTVTDP